MIATTTVHHVAQTTGFFHEVNALLMALQGIAVVSELTVTARVEHRPGDYLTFECRHLDARIRLPLVAPIQAALANRLPDIIEITIVPGRDKDRGYVRQTAGFQRFLDAIIPPLVVAYLERFRSELEIKFSSRPTWPAAWQMGWAVRNAASHHGRVFDKPNRAPVCWQGLNFSPSDEPNTKLLPQLNGADLLVLMLDMEATRPTGQVSKVAPSST
jgi:hypothetical protein